MALFSKHDRKKSTKAVKNGATTIAYGTKITGDIFLSASLHIDGEFEGSIHSDNIITIGIKGRVIGDIIAKGIAINGLFKGSIESATIELLPNASAKGKLTYHELIIEKGANFEGETIFREANLLDIPVNRLEADIPLTLPES